MPKDEVVAMGDGGTGSLTGDNGLDKAGVTRNEDVEGIEEIMGHVVPEQETDADTTRVAL